MEDLPEENSPLPLSSEPLLSAALSAPEVIDPAYARIAEAVAALLAPTIFSAVEAAVTQGMAQLLKELSKQLQRIQETEHWLSFIEDEMLQASNAFHVHDEALQAIQEKLEDLENHSRWNNLRIIGIPESVKANELAKLCSSALPKALGFDTQ